MVVGTGAFFVPGIDAAHLRRQGLSDARNAAGHGYVSDPLSWPWTTHRDMLGAVVEPWVTADALAEALGAPRRGHAAQGQNRRQRAGSLAGCRASPGSITGAGEDVPLGAYELRVGGVARGTITVVNAGTEIQGEIEFDTDPDEPGELPLTFDPRGKTLEVVQGATVFFSSTLGGGGGPGVCTPPTETEVPLLNVGPVGSAADAGKPQATSNGSQGQGTRGQVSGGTLHQSSSGLRSAGVSVSVPRDLSSW